MHSRTRRWLATAVAGLTVAGVLAGCGSSGSGAGGSAAGGGDTVRIGVGIDAAYAPFFLAQKDGLFKKAGVNVEIVQFGRGGDAVQAIAGKQVEMAGNSDTTTITLLAQNPDLRALYIYEQSGKYLKVVARPGITSANQIKKMGVVPGLSDYMAQKYFQANNVDLSSVKFVTADPPELPTLAKKGTVDAYLLWEPWPTQGIALGLHVLTDTGSYGYSYVHWMVTSGEWLKGHQADAAKISQVLFDASKTVASDPAAAADAVNAETKISVSDAKTAIEQVTWDVRPFDAKDMSSYADQVQYFIDKKVLKTTPDLHTAILNSWLTDNVKGS
jgi:ABC-type nitrate/sulfonate/bicarbonate transport system substrate-binding protein